LYAQISQGETHLSTISQTRIIGSTVYMLDMVSAYSITIINVAVAILAILTIALGLLFHKKEAKRDVFWIAWIIVAGIFGVSVYYGGEAINRAFMFMLLPTCYFAVKFLSKKLGILILVLMILIFIHIPAHYTAEMRTYVPTSELKGTAFYAKYAPSTAPFFYENLVFLPDNENFTGTQINIRGTVTFYSLPSQELVNETAGKAAFIISSNLQKNLYLYFFGVDLLEHLNLDDHYNRIYDNEEYRVYARINA
jgi:hypothetical protein